MNDMAEVFQELRRRGWRLLREGPHQMWAYGSSRMAIPRTPSDWRALTNVLATARRLERAEDGPPVEEDPVPRMALEPGHGLALVSEPIRSGPPMVRCVICGREVPRRRTLYCGSVRACRCHAGVAEAAQG